MTQSAVKLSTIPHLHNSGKVIHIFIAGIGAVGGTLIRQINRLRHPYIRTELTGYCNSSTVRWMENGRSVSTDDLLAHGKEKKWQEILSRLKKSGNTPLVFVDATGSSEVAGLYRELLESGIHVVTPSKLANSASQTRFHELIHTARENKVQYLYETTVGAGLPVIKTLHELLATGDEVLEISGVLSGTMTYLFHQLEQGESFSSSVLRARSLGYAEPDPRDDLSGEDVARKFLILARTCGLEIERESFESESLIPAALKKTDSVTFLEKLPESDEEWKKRIENELERNHTLRYTGQLKDGKIRIGVESVPKTSPIGSLTGTNNLIQIKSRRYFDQPLIIQGPGAGKEVTAAGILGDILSIQL